MVQKLIELSPLFKEVFDKNVPLDYQIKVLNLTFKLEKAKWLQTPAAKLRMQADDDQKPYFLQDSNFSGGLVPAAFKRTEVPRLTTKGSHFHNMKKEHKWAVIQKLTKNFSCSIVDFDFSRAHANIAIRLQGEGLTLLKNCVTSPTFWSNQTQQSLPKRHGTSLQLDSKSCRSVLKVMLYGGNPFSPERIWDNFSQANASMVLELGEDKTFFRETQRYKDFLSVFAEDPVVKEVKWLNKKCYDFLGERVYTFDRTSPYQIHSKHLGVSRVLKFFKVVMLTVLTRACLQKGLLPLDHDGILCLDPYCQKPTLLARALTMLCSKWSKYLLNEQTLDIGPKKVSYKGKMQVVNFLQTLLLKSRL